MFPCLSWRGFLSKPLTKQTKNTNKKMETKNKKQKQKRLNWAELPLLQSLTRNQPDLSSWKIEASPSVLDATPSDWLSLWQKQVVTARLVGKHWWPQWERQCSAAPCPFNCDHLAVALHWHKHSGGTTSPLRISHLVRGGGGGGEITPEITKGMFLAKSGFQKMWSDFLSFSATLWWQL